MNHNTTNELPEKVKVFPESRPDSVHQGLCDVGEEGRKAVFDGLQKMFAEGRILPRVPYYGVDGRKYVDCVIGEVSSIRVFRKNKKHLDGDFVKTLKQGLVLTPTQGIVVRQFRNKLRKVLTKVHEDVFSVSSQVVLTPSSSPRNSQCSTGTRRSDRARSMVLVRAVLTPSPRPETSQEMGGVS